MPFSTEFMFDEMPFSTIFFAVFYIKLSLKKLRFPIDGINDCGKRFQLLRCSGL